MSLAQLHCSEPSVLDIQSKNLILGFENRIKCLNSVFWMAHDAIDKQQKTILVVNQKDDLEYINYFLSKYKLKDLSLIVNPVQELLSPIAINKLNSPKESFNGMEEFEIVESTVNDLSNEIQNHLRNLKAPKLGQLNILDIQKRMRSLAENSEQLEIDLFRLIPFEKYKEKKALLIKASQLYSPDYRFKEGKELFSKDLFKTVTLDSVRIMLDDVLENLAIVHKEMRASEELILNSIGSEKLEEVNQVNKLLEKIRSFKHTTLLSPTDSEKLIHLKNEFIRITKMFSTSEDEPKSIINSVEILYKQYLENINSNRQARKKHLLKRLTKNSGLPNVAELMGDMDKICQKFGALEILNNWQVPRANSFYDFKLMHTDLVNQIELAKFYLSNSHDFIEWMEFFSNLDVKDQILISAFISKKSDWLELFETSYLQEFFSEEIVNFKDLTNLNSNLEMALAKYEELYCSKILSQNIEHANAELLPLMNGVYQKMTWQKFIEDNSDLLIKKFPLLIIDGSTYEKYIDILTAHIDKVISLNYIPHHLPNEAWSSNVVAGYASNFIKNAVPKFGSVEESEIRNVSGSEYNVNRSMKHMNTSELNLLSIYIGQAVKETNNNFKIFQLKSQTFISMISDDKNGELFQILNPYGAKEIFSTEENYNLLPGIFSDVKLQPVIIVEDNLINANAEEFDLRQFVLMEKIKTMGIKIISINNFKLLTDSNYTIESLMAKIVVKDKVVKSLAEA